MSDFKRYKNTIFNIMMSDMDKKNLGLLTDETIKYIAEMNKITDDSEWNSIYDKCMGYDVLFKDYIKYAILLSDNIPISYREKLVKTLSRDELNIIMEFKKCSPLEADYYLQRKNYNILRDMEKCKDISRNALTHLMGYPIKKVARMKFAPLVYTKGDNIYPYQRANKNYPITH